MVKRVLAEDELLVQGQLEGDWHLVPLELVLRLVKQLWSMMVQRVLAEDELLVQGLLEVDWHLVQLELVLRLVKQLW